MKTYVVPLFLLFFTIVSGAKWEYGKHNGCSYNFRQSPREKYQNNQKDPLIIWLGSPSTALQVQGKFGLLPIPTVWSSYANTLYLNCFAAVDEASYLHDAIEFLTGWCQSRNFQSFCMRDLYLTGNYDDAVGGRYVLSLAKQISLDTLWSNNGEKPKLRGVAVGFLPMQPSSIFVPHRSFESANNLNFWTWDRASKPIVCNGLASQVEFQMHDIKLTYVPKPSETVGMETLEYELCSVSTWDQCYKHDQIAEFSEYYKIKPPLPYDELLVGLPYGHDTNSISSSGKGFPDCDCTKTDEYLRIESLVDSILSANASVLSYSTIRKSSDFICSFYIGIFRSENIRFVPASDTSVRSSLLNQAIYDFNAASLQEMPPSWASSTAVNTVPGYVQDGRSSREDEHCDDGPLVGTGQRVSLCSEADPGLMFMQFESATTQSSLSSSQYHGAVLSRSGALDILGNLLDKQNEVDFVELIVMEQLSATAA